MAVIIDADNDLVDDAVDNCLGAANTSQRDTDGDGYGNWCDADLNNDLKVNFADLSIFRCQLRHQQRQCRSGWQRQRELRRPRPFQGAVRQAAGALSYSTLKLSGWVTERRAGA